MRFLLVIVAGAIALFAAGCNSVLEPIEQRFLFRPWFSDQARLASVVRTAAWPVGEPMVAAREWHCGSELQDA